MKNITSILKRALRKSANNIIKEDGTHGSNMQHSNCTTPSRAPNTFSGNPGGAQCAGKIRAIKCSTMPSGWDVLVDGNPCQQPGTSCHSDTYHIKVFPPGITMSSPYSNPADDSCHGGYTPVVGDYILSADGSGIQGSRVGWQIVQVLSTEDECDGPRRNHPACVSTLNMGCTDPNANNYNSVANQDCNGDAPGTNNPGWDSCCTYNSLPISGCTDSNAINYDPLATIDDGSCIFTGCTDPTALNYDPNATQDDGSCFFSTFDCISGLCEENIAGTGTHANLDVCLLSEECDRYECTKSQVPAAMEEQINPNNLTKADPEVSPSTDGPTNTDPGDPSDFPTISGCVKCDVSRYNVVNGAWDPLCKYFTIEECDKDCAEPIEPPVDPCEDFTLGIFQGINPCCELCGTDGSGGWNTTTMILPSTHPNLPQCWNTCQCCTMPINCTTNPVEGCWSCHGNPQVGGSCWQAPQSWITTIGMPQGFNFYSTEADCIGAGIGCMKVITPPVDPTQDIEPSALARPNDDEDLSKDLLQTPQLQEGLRLKGELLNRSRMTKLANIKKK